MPGGTGLLRRHPGPAGWGGSAGKQPPSTAPGLQPTLGTPRWVVLALDKNFPVLVPWSVWQSWVAILVGETGEGAMLLHPPDV